MSFYYLTGSKMNAFGRGTVTVSPTESSVAPKANLYDSDPSTPHIAGSVAADSYMRVQVQALTNPGFETSTLASWTDNDQGTGTSTETATGAEVRTGTKACEMTGTDTSNYGSRYQDITVAAGEYRKATVYAIAIGSGTAKLFLRNLKTGNYYNGSAWASTRAAAGSSAATSFTAVTVTYQVEDFDTCRADTVTLRWEIACEAGNVAFDDCLDVPGVTFAGIFGHNYGNVISPLVQSSDDGSAWTTRATMTIKRPAFFSIFAIIYAEYWQIKLSGTPHESPYTGEAVLGQYQTSTTSPQWGFPKTRAFPGSRQRGPSSRAHVYNYATDPPQDVELKFSARTAAASAELAESLWLRSGQGLYPVIFVPIDTETDVYYGRLMDPVVVERPFSGVYDTTLTLVGDPFPTVGS